MLVHLLTCDQLIRSPASDGSSCVGSPEKLPEAEPLEPITSVAHRLVASVAEGEGDAVQVHLFRAVGFHGSSFKTLTWKRSY